MLGCWCGLIRRLMIAREGSIVCVKWQTDGYRRPFPSKEGRHGKNYIAQCLMPIHICIFSLSGVRLQLSWVLNRFAKCKACGFGNIILKILRSASAYSGSMKIWQK